MPVIFRSGAECAPDYEVVEIKQESEFVLWLAAKEAIKSTYLHWLGGEFQRCVPCLGQYECPWCPRPTRWEAYAPVSWHKTVPKSKEELERLKPGQSATKKVWTASILRVTKSLAGLLREDHVGQVIEVGRVVPTRKNSPMKWTVLEIVDRSCLPAIAPFDPIPSMMRIFGQFALMDGSKKLKVDAPADLVAKEKQLDEFAAQGDVDSPWPAGSGPSEGGVQ